MLDAAHRGYEYQDLLVAIRLVDLILGRLTETLVDEQLFSGDLFDDLTIRFGDRRERTQIKHTTGQPTPLELSVFTSDARNLKLDRVVASIVADLKGPGVNWPDTRYRIVTRNVAPTDPSLLAVLRPPTSDPGAFVPGMLSQRFEFDVDAIWPIDTGTPRTGPQPFAFLQASGVSRTDVASACSRLIVEVGSPAASFDLTVPGPAEVLLLDRVRQEVGAESYRIRSASRVADT